MKTGRATVKEINGVPPGHTPITVTLDPWLSLRALAGYSGLSIRKLRYLLVDPHHPLPGYRVDAKILVRRSDFDRWMAGHKMFSPLDTMVNDVIRDLRELTARRR